jgi:FMN phosphatase YigB (HAD superfamily)
MTTAAHAGGGSTPRALLIDSGGVLLQMSGNLLQVASLLYGVHISEHDALRGVYAADASAVSDPALAALPFAARWGRAVSCADEVALAIWDHLHSHVSPSVLWSRVNAEVITLLAALPPGLPKVVVSNSVGHAAAEIEAVGLRRHFPVVLDSGQVGVEKPDRRIFELASCLTGVDLGACLYVSDRLDGPLGGELAQILYDPYGLYLSQVLPYGVQRVRHLAMVAEVFCGSDSRVNSDSLGPHTPEGQEAHFG